MDNLLLTPCADNESQDTFVDHPAESDSQDGRTSASPSEEEGSPSNNSADREILNDLNLEQAQLEQQLSVVKAKKSMLVTGVLKRPVIVVDYYNTAAKCILANMEEKKKWTAVDYLDDPILKERITGTASYISLAASNDILKKFSKFFVIKSFCSPAQGDELLDLVRRTFTLRQSTKKGEKCVLDEVRNAWTKSLGVLIIGKMVNPLIPRHTGMSLHDYQNRIVKIAERLRETLFGTENDTVFYYGAENGSDIKSIILPTKDEIVANITAKLEDRETAETVYLRKQLQLYDLCVGGSISTNDEEKEMNKRSGSVIQDYRMGKMFRNNTVVAPDSGSRGKQRMFSSYSFVELPTSMTPIPPAGVSNHGSRSADSSGSSASAGSSNKRKLSFVASVPTNGSSIGPSSSRDAAKATEGGDGAEDMQQEVLGGGDKDSSGEEDQEDEEEAMELFDDDDDDDDDPYYSARRAEEECVAAVGRAASRNQSKTSVVVKERKAIAKPAAPRQRTAATAAAATTLEPGNKKTAATTATTLEPGNKKKTKAAQSKTTKKLEESQYPVGETD